MSKKIFSLWAVLLLCAGKTVAQPHNPFGNALIPDMVADASIQEIDGVFYCYATTDGLRTRTCHVRSAGGVEIKGLCELAL